MDRRMCLCWPKCCSFACANILRTTHANSSLTCNWRSNPHCLDHCIWLSKIGHNLHVSNWSHSPAHIRLSTFFPHMHMPFHIWALQRTKTHETKRERERKGENKIINGESLGNWIVLVASIWWAKFIFKNFYGKPQTTKTFWERRGETSCNRHHRRLYRRQQQWYKRDWRRFEVVS